MCASSFFFISAKLARVSAWSLNNHFLVGLGSLNNQFLNAGFQLDDSKLLYCNPSAKLLSRNWQGSGHGTIRVFEGRCGDSRLNQGYQSLLYLSRFTFYPSKLINVKTTEMYTTFKTLPSLNSWIAFHMWNFSWRFGALLKASSGQSFYASVFTFSKKHPMAPFLSLTNSWGTSTSRRCQDSFRNPRGKPRICQDNGSEYTRQVVVSPNI